MKSFHGWIPVGHGWNPLEATDKKERIRRGKERGWLSVTTYRLLQVGSLGSLS